MVEKLYLRNRGDKDYFLESRTSTSASVVGVLNPDHFAEHKLSIKNCEEIANGYDLDELEELAQKDIHNLKPINPHPASFFAGYRRGFQKALEILKDKKFSEEDIKKAMDLNRKALWTQDEVIQSIQQTEWQVEIVMEDCGVEKVYLGKNNSVSSSETPEHKSVLWLKAENISDKQAENIWNTRLPKYDQDGCLILKRKENVDKGN